MTQCHVPFHREETVSGRLLLTVEQLFLCRCLALAGPRPSVNPEVFSGPDIGTNADGALETRCSKLYRLDSSASHHVQLCRLRAGAGRQRNTVLMYSPGFVRATKSQVGSAQDTRSLERTVAGLRATLHASIQAVPREVWESMLAGDPESYDFYRAVEPTPPPGITLAAISVSEAERILAVAPIFYVNYRLDTPLQGGLRRVTEWVNKRLPQLLRLSVIGIGSPLSDNCTIGFSRQLGPGDRARVFGAMLDRLEEEARARRISLLAVKALGKLTPDIGESLAARGYLRATTVPLAMLPMPFSTFEAWLDSLRKKERIYFRKKLKSAEQLRIEYRTSIKGLEEPINAMFDGTLRQSNVDYGDFDKLHPDYFTRIVDSLGDGKQMMLCWKGGQLVSFQLCLIGHDRIINKQLGMKYPEARELNLFFVNWLLLVRYAIEKRIHLIEMGATTYTTKLLFGGHLERRWLYFRCRWSIATAVVRPFLWLCDFERNDPELRNLKFAVREQNFET